MSGSQVRISSLALLALVLQTGAGAADTVSAQLIGYEEVPAIFSTSKGTFQGTITPNSVTYSLAYTALSGSVQQAHIHFGQRGVNGNITAFLCTNLGNGPPGTQGCPNSGTVSGTITGAKLSNVPTQGILTGQIVKFIQAIKAGRAYVNVHTTAFPGGEIRGQLKVTP